MFCRLGGVMPTVATQLHKQHIDGVIEAALSQSDLEAKVQIHFFAYRTRFSEIFTSANKPYPPSAYVMQPNSGLLRLDATTHIACHYGHR